MPTRHKLLSKRSWLNPALMGRAISQPAGVEIIFERRVGRDSLSLHPKRARRQHGDLALPEIAAASVMHRRFGPVVANDGPAARRLALFEIREDMRVGKAQAHRRRVRARDFPKPGARLPQDRGSRGGNEQSSCTSQQESRICLHAPQLTTRFLKNQDTSSSAIGKLCEQKAQSTRMSPSSPTIASRSSAGKRAITDRT